MTDHCILIFQELVRSIFIIAKEYTSSSDKEFQKTIDEKILPLDVQVKISNFALNIISNESYDIEYDDMTIEYSLFYCITNMVYGLPFRHLLIKQQLNGSKPLITIYDVPARWHHNLDYQVQIKVKRKITKTKTDVNNNDLNWSYSSLIGYFGKSFSFVISFIHIANGLKVVFNELLNLLHRSKA